MYSLAVFVVALLAVVNGGNAPFVTPCHMDDTACLKTSAQNVIPVFSVGVPELGIKPLDPLQVDRIKSTQAGLQMDFSNTVVKGLRHCLVLSLKRLNQKMYFDVQCSVTLIGDYNLGGKLLILAIEGSGKYKIKIRDIVVRIEFDMHEVDIGGVTYWNIPTWKHNAEVLTGVEYHFQNLFNGNKPLAANIHQFANANWKDIFTEVSPPIVHGVVKAIVAETKKLFASVPKNELSLD